MFRITKNFSNTKLVLVRKHIADGSCSALIILRDQPHPKQQSRYYSSPNNSPRDCDAGPAAPKSRKLFYGVIGATLLTGAAVVYAKSSPETRNWLESNIPWANDFVALVYQENTTYWKFTINQFNTATTALSHFMFGKEGVSPTHIKPRSEQNLDADAAKKIAMKDYQLPPTKFEPLYVEEKVITAPKVESKATVIQTEKCEPSPEPAVHITKDMVDLEHDMHENTKLAVDRYRLAAACCADANKALFKIVESSLVDLDKKHFVALQGHVSERDTTLKQAEDASRKAKCALDTLERLLAAGVQAPGERVAATRRHMQQFRADLRAAEDAYRRERERAVLSDRYWNKVEAARKMYKDELQALFPGLDLSARTLELKGDTDLLLVYTLRQIQYLQNQIAELQTVGETKINRAIECHDEKEIIEAKVENLVLAERIKREKEYQKQALELQAEANRVLKDQLKKQIELQLEVQQDKLNKKEKEVMAKFSRRVSEELQNESIAFKKELAAMAGKMKAIEQTLKERAKAEAEARRSQAVWAAAEALLAATRRAAPSADITNELKALEKAGKGDALVEAILKTIPSDVREQGIVTEKSLRDRFEQMQQTAVKVALVGADGASLPVYFLSWLQSKFLFQKFAEIPADELNNLPTDFTKLDTFDIIQRAKYHMERGDVAAALRYVALLRGGARAAAAAWRRAARRHLEVRQAAEAVMAHASVAGLLYL